MTTLNSFNSLNGLNGVNGLTSANGIDTTFITPENCIAVMAVNKVINSVNAIICPPTIPPTPTEGVTWIFFPKTCGNCEALNIKCDVWLGFNSATGAGVINNTKHADNTSVTGTNLTAGFSCGTGCNPCNPCNSCNSCATCSISGVPCQTNQTGITVNIEFAAGVASVVSRNACPCATVIFLNLDNRLGYTAVFDNSDGDPGLDFVFPECCGGSANVVYGPTTKAAFDAYRKVAKHSISTKAMTADTKKRYVLTEVAKFAAQTIATSSNSCENPCSRGTNNSGCGSGGGGCEGREGREGCERREGGRCGGGCGEERGRCESRGGCETRCESRCGGERGGCQGCKECQRPRRRRPIKSCEKACERKTSGKCGCASCRTVL